MYLSQLDTKTIQIATMFHFSFFCPLFHEESFTLYPPLDHLHTPPVDHPNPYLSTCPIRHLFWFPVSCGTQGSVVQRSFPHKCGQKSSCSVFNAVVVAFPQIFLDFLPSRMFERHVPIIGVSWRIILTDGVHIVNCIHHIRGGVPPRTTLTCSPSLRL